ncbi:uncharacterized protein LOC134807038 [Pan troglodytes]|uniref:uncharacterized protein LOC134807038 n=1 Tax=Pan troglodytes TaxID=9598 RepID=UPI0030140735
MPGSLRGADPTQDERRQIAGDAPGDPRALAGRGVVGRTYTGSGEASGRLGLQLVLATEELLRDSAIGCTFCDRCQPVGAQRLLAQSLALAAPGPEDREVVKLLIAAYVRRRARRHKGASSATSQGRVFRDVTRARLPRRHKGASSATSQGRVFRDVTRARLRRHHRGGPLASQRRGCSATSLGRYGSWSWAVFSSEWGLMMIIPHLLRDKDQRATTATSPRTRQCWGTENEGVQLWPSQSSGGDETHLPLSLWARLMPGASVDRGHAPGLPKLEKAARLRSEGQNSTVSPTESRWEQGQWLPRLCGRIRFLAVEVACTPQLVLPVSNDWSFLLLSLHLPPSPSPALLL